MKTLTVEEVAALRYARKQVQAGLPYICVSISENLGCCYSVVLELPLIKEICEFLDGASTVEAWLDIMPRPDGASTVEAWLDIMPRWGVVKTYRIAIIDTLLARRGVFIKEQ